MADKPIVDFFRVGASSLIKHFCDEINLVERINQATLWDPNQCKLSPGEHTLAMVINILSGRMPLSRVNEFYETQDTEVLFGKDVSAQDFNDDALGRTLDRLHEASPKDIFTSITLESLMTADDPLLFAHGDTTTKSFAGNYDREPKDDVVRIERGYNKDHRPDLKQIVVGMVAVNQGTPLFGNVCNGSHDDPTWNKNMIDTIANVLSAEQIKKLVYVADSKFFSKNNILKAANSGLKFISLVSEQHGLRKKAIKHALKHKDMTDVGQLSSNKNASSYSIKEWETKHHGLDLRLVVVHSSSLFKVKQETFHRKLEKERDELEDQIEKLSKQEFSCEEDAQKAWKKWKQSYKKSLFPMDAKVQTITRNAKRKKRGRPKKDEIPEQETIYTLSVSLQPVPDEVIAEKERHMGYFVLATNALDKEKLPTENILREYKQQSTVELRFKFLKDPTFVDALFLDNPARIEALGYLLMISLYIYMTIERRLRIAVADKKIRLQPVRGNYTRKPTARQILILLQTVSVMKWYDADDQEWYREVRYKDEVKKVFDLLQFDPDSYITVKERSYSNKFFP